MAADQLTLREDDPATASQRRLPPERSRRGQKPFRAKVLGLVRSGSGFINSYKLRNVELLAGPIRPNFYRAYG